MRSSRSQTPSPPPYLQQRPLVAALLLSATAVAFAVAAALALSSCSKRTTAPTRPKCQFTSDCANAETCYLGECYPTASCLERKNCNNVPVCTGMRCICTDDTNRCNPVCVTDNDCAASGQCVNGVCTPYTAQFNGTPPASADRGALKVGIGRVELDYPMGVSMAGYASRTGPRTPYQDLLGGSNAVHDKPDVRAIAFDDGKEMFVLVRIPLCWSTDEIIADVVKKVAAKTGVNLLDHIITSAPHSHALPARFWHLAKGFGFGYFGYDEFNFEIFDRITSSIAEGVIAAVNARQPARFGYKVIDDFDHEGKIHRDRRGENNDIPNWLQKDDRMLLMRIDDMSGKPLAVMTHFGMHGTVYDNDNPILTMDSGGGVERILNDRASAKYGTSVLGVFLQGNAGDISPAGDDLGHNRAERLQLIGARTWKVIEPALDQIQTSANVEVGIVAGRVAISRDTLGYKPGEFYDKNVVCQNSPPYFRYGAFQCVAGIPPATGFVDGTLECIFAVECMTNGYPLPQFGKTYLAAFRLGDLAVTTVPGEPLSEFGRSLADRVKAVIPGINTAITLGYSMDHHFYLMNEPDWFKGGYEPSRDIWGWKMAPYFADKAVALASELAKPPEQRHWDNGKLKPMVWDDPPQDEASVVPNESEGPADDILADVPATVERLDIVEFSWRGGFPGVDRPHVVLEVQATQGFAPFTRPGGLVYDDQSFNFMTHYDGHCSVSECKLHKWRVSWDEGRDFPAGTYRFAITGRAWKSGAVVPYAVHSSAFKVVPSTKLAIYGLKTSSNQIEGRIVDPPAVRYTDNADGTKSADATVGFFMRSELVPSALGAPMADGMVLMASGTITPMGQMLAVTSTITGQVTAATVNEDRQTISGYDQAQKPVFQSAGARPTTKFLLDSTTLAGGPAGAYRVKLTLTDPLGNSGTITTTISK
jgi:hypothetical protein